MEIWIILNPLIRFILYIAVFGSIGTFIFVLYFRDVLTTSQLSYCTTISQNFTKVGILASFLSILSIPGNMSGDFLGILDIDMISLSFSTLTLKSSFFYL